MKHVAVLVAAGIFAAPLVAQEQVYIYVKYKDAVGVSSRHKLDCLDAKCKVDIKSHEGEISLSPAQEKELLDALQAEAKQFVFAADSASSDRQIKVKIRYETPRKRLSIERRLPDDAAVDLAPEMLQVIKTHLDLDLSEPVAPELAADEEPSAKPDPQAKAK